MNVQRKHPAHMPLVERHNEPIVLFVTVCIKNRKSILANVTSHQRLIDSWSQAKNWLVGSYVIMPDHVHLFCIPGAWPPPPLALWMKYWKGHFTKLGDYRESPWQKDFWDTQIRGTNHYVEKRNYVLNNPVRKGLVKKPDEWLYRGELNVIRW